MFCCFNQKQCVTIKVYVEELLNSLSFHGIPLGKWNSKGSSKFFKIKGRVRSGYFTTVYGSNTHIRMCLTQLLSYWVVLENLNFFVELKKTQRCRKLFLSKEASLLKSFRELWISFVYQWNIPLSKLTKALQNAADMVTSSYCQTCESQNL